MPEPTIKSAPIQRYTAPVRRGFGHLCHAIVIRPSPTNPDPLTTYFASLSPHQHSDVQAAVNYMSQQFAEEVAKTQIPAHLLQRPAINRPPVAGPSSDSDANASDLDADPDPETDDSNPDPIDDGLEGA